METLYFQVVKNSLRLVYRPTQPKGHGNSGRNHVSGWTTTKAQTRATAEAGYLGWIFSECRPP